jgi:multisubunit Na+/H+ antiporter MnhF subunit
VLYALEKRVGQSQPCIESLVYLGRMRLALGRTKSAIDAFQRALVLDPDRKDVDVELAIARRRSRRTIAPLPFGLTSILAAILVFELVCVTLFFLGEIGGLLFRLVFAGGLGVIGLIQLQRTLPLRFPRMPSLRTLFVLFAGITAGVTLARFGMLPRHASAGFAITLLLVSVEELLFRAYVGRALETKLVGVTTCVLTSTALFLLYQLTYTSSTTREVVMSVAVLGLPAALLHHARKSAFEAYIFRVSAALIIVLISFYNAF